MKRIIKVELTKEEYEKLLTIAHLKGQTPEFIAKTGTFIYMQRLEKTSIKEIKKDYDRVKGLTT